MYVRSRHFTTLGFLLPGPTSIFGFWHPAMPEAAACAMPRAGVIAGCQNPKIGSREGMPESKTLENKNASRLISTKGEEE